MQLSSVLRTGGCDGGGTRLARAEPGAVIRADAGLGGDRLTDAGRPLQWNGGRCASLPGLEDYGRAAGAGALDVEAVPADVDPLSRQRRGRRRCRRLRRGRGLHASEPTRMAVEPVAVVLLVEAPLTSLSGLQAAVLASYDG